MNAFIDKQPYEAYYVDFDFVNVLQESDEVTSATVTAVDDLGADKTNVITATVKQHVESPKVFVWVRAGTSGRVYTITCKIVTVNGEKYESEGTISVVES